MNKENVNKICVKGTCGCPRLSSVAATPRYMQCQSLV